MKQGSRLNLHGISSDIDFTIPSQDLTTNGWLPTDLGLREIGINTNRGELYYRTISEIFNVLTIKNDSFVHGSVINSSQYNVLLGTNITNTGLYNYLNGLNLTNTGNYNIASGSDMSITGSYNIGTGDNGIITASNSIFNINLVSSSSVADFSNSFVIANNSENLDIEDSIINVFDTDTFEATKSLIVAKFDTTTNIATSIFVGDIKNLTSPKSSFGINSNNGNFCFSEQLFTDPTLPSDQALQSYVGTFGEFANVDTTETKMLSNYSNGTNWKLLDNEIYQVNISIVVLDATHNKAQFNGSGVITTNHGDLGLTITETYADIAISSDITFSASVASNALLIECTNNSASKISVAARVDYVKMIFNV